MKLCKDPQCLRFGIALKESEFSRNSYYKKRGDRSGLSVYCRRCCQRKVNNYRESAGVMRNKIPPPNFPVPEPPEEVMKGAPITRVKTALKMGFNTREAIKHATKLTEDVVGNVLARLVFELEEVKIVRTSDNAHFQMKAA